MTNIRTISKISGYPWRTRLWFLLTGRLTVWVSTRCQFDAGRVNATVEVEFGKPETSPQVAFLASEER